MLMLLFFFFFLKSIRKYDMKLKFPLTILPLSSSMTRSPETKTGQTQGRGIKCTCEEPDVPQGSLEHLTEAALELNTLQEAVGDQVSLIVILLAVWEKYCPTHFQFVFVVLRFCPKCCKTICTGTSVLCKFQHASWIVGSTSFMTS